MSRPQIIVDTETTGLDSSRHEIWELALIKRDVDIEHLWRMKPDLVKADSTALAVGRFYERTSKMCGKCSSSYVHDLTRPPAGRYGDPEWSGQSALAAEVARTLDGATLIAANPTFDAGFLAAFLNQHGQAATWHYRLRDIGSIAYGYLHACLALGIEGHDAAMGVPDMDASTDDFARALGVAPDQFERHSALGDCRLVAAMLGVIEGGAS